MPTLITGKTKILGLIADPILQARSPNMANALLDDRSQFGAFALLPMHVSSEGLKEFVIGLRRLHNFAGAIVSMPHKAEMAYLVDELTPEAELVGAVNVIRKTADGKLVGTLLDGEGFVGGLRNAGHTVKGTNCYLAGAGGAASAIAFSLAKHGCATLTIQNRTSTKADALAEKLRRTFPHIRVMSTVDTNGTYDITVNGTSLGMQDGDDLPISAQIIDRSSLVAECVVAPEITRFLELARKYKRKIHTGVPMLSAQMDMMLSFMGVE
jgi:shikimate dehydrogenase